ncbi:MAG: hypothetical protein AAF346_02670 [Pseudomonadota bacterium]
MKRSFLLSAVAAAAGLALASTSALAGPTAAPSGVAALELLGSGQSSIQHVHFRNSRHCHKRRRVCRRVTLASGKTVRRCTTRRAFCHGAARTFSAPRGSH